MSQRYKMVTICRWMYRTDKWILAPITAYSLGQLHGLFRAWNVSSKLGKSKPDRTFLNISLDGLKQAAQALEDIAPSVLHRSRSHCGIRNGLCSVSRIRARLYSLRVRGYGFVATVSLRVSRLLKRL